MNNALMRALGWMIAASALLALSPPPALAAPVDWTTVGASSSSELPGWPASHLFDGDTNTVWSSNGHATPQNREWMTLLLDTVHDVNYLNLATRFADGNSFGFPVSFTVYWLDESNVWHSAISVVRYARPKSLWVKIALPEAVRTRYLYVDATLLGDDQMGNGTRYFQLAEARAGFDPAQNTEYTPSIAHASSQLWPASSVYDSAPWSVWSTEIRPTASGGDWLAFWWPTGVAKVNYVRLLPRNYNGKALGFPKSFTILWADYAGGAGKWTQIVASSTQPDGQGWLTIPLPYAVPTDGIQVAANALGTDDNGSYVFQLAEARAGYSPAFAQSSPYEHFDVNHILSTGQSLSVGSHGEVTAPDTRSASWFGNKMFAGGVVRPGVSSAFGPITAPAELDTLTSLREITKETMSTAMADHISWRRRTDLPLIRTDRPVHQILVSGSGIGSMRYSQIGKLPAGASCPYPIAADNPTYTCAYANSIEQVAAAHDAADQLGQTHAVRVVTTVHGESDHSGKNTHYAADLAQWQRDYEQDIKRITGQQGVIPLLQTQMSSWTRYGASAQSLIPQAQLAAHMANRGRVVLVGPKYNLAYSDDGIHLSARGYRNMGEYYAKAYRRIVLEGGTWEPVRPRSITRVGNVITAKFHVPVAPLAFDTTLVKNPGNFGFEVVEGANKVPIPITSIALSGADTVTITLARTPTGSNPQLRYAFTGTEGNLAGPTTGARGNLRDSDATPSRYYEQKPLYNWAVHFELPVPFADR